MNANLMPTQAGDFKWGAKKVSLMAQWQQYGASGVGVGAVVGVSVGVVGLALLNTD